MRVWIAKAKIKAFGFGCLVGATLFTSNALGADSLARCIKSELHFAYSPQKLSEALEALPTLRTYVLEMMKDPEFPRTIKSVVKHALEDRETEIVQLTSEIRKSWNIPDKYKAIADPASEKPIYSWSYSDAQATGNQELADTVHLDFKSGHGILVPDRIPSSDDNDLTALIHELAHVKMSSVLANHFERICRRLPRTFCMKAADGEIALNAQLLELIEERYAHEQEFLALKSSLAILPFDWHKRWDKELRSMAPKEVAEEIGRDVARTYKITDPQVLAVADVPISEILLGGPAVREVDEALRLYAGVNYYFRPRQEELPVALGFLRRMRSAEGKKVSRIPSFEELRTNITALLDSQQGRRRFNELFARLAKNLGKTPESQLEFLQIVRDPQIYALLVHRARWQLPPVDALAWTPVTKVIAEAVWTP